MRAFLALVALDLKLSTRALLAPLADKPAAARLAVIAAALVGLHAAAWPVGLWIGAHEGADSLAAALRTGLLFVLPWTVSNPLSTLARSFATRGDLDLLLASPAPMRAVFGARLLALGLESVGAAGLLIGPVADVCALQGRPHWLALYPALLGAGLAGAALGAALALALAATLGPRRARVVSQLAAALIGGSAALAVQAAVFLPPGSREKLAAWLPADLLGPAVRAASGEPRALTVWLCGALAIYALAALTLAGRFARVAQMSAGVSATGRAAAEPRFTASLAGALRAKEGRLLWRDPWLLSQMGLQALYTLPIGFILWRNGGVTAQPGIAFAPTLVVIAGQLSASLAWIALCGEDAPDFLATAPTTRAALERAKLGAVALPVAIALAPALTALAFVSPRAAATALICGAGAAVSGALLMLWRQAPARRGLVLRRHSQSKAVALIEHWLSLCWAGTTGMAAMGSAFALAPLGIALATLYWARPRTNR
jgi:ABC-2 type transport system permease protein